MTSIRSMPATDAYRDGWDRIWGIKKLSQQKQHHYIKVRCGLCGKIMRRERVYGEPEPHPYYRDHYSLKHCDSCEAKHL